MANFWDEYLKSLWSGGSGDQARAAASAGPGPKPAVATPTPRPESPQPTPTPTPVPTPRPAPQDPVGAAQGQQPYDPNAQSFLPAANALAAVQGIQQGQSAGQALRNTAFATGAPINTLDMNTIPVGGFGSGFGYGSQPQPDFLNQGSQQPSVTGYKWNAGTGGVSGGNNDWTRLFMSDGTMQSFTGGIPDNQPLPPTQYAAPLLNGERSPFADPSVGALEGAQRSTNLYGQQVINTSGNGQIISGKGPTVGSLGFNRWKDQNTGAQTINTPSGGTIMAGPARGGGLRKKMTPGSTYSLGGWY